MAVRRVTIELDDVPDAAKRTSSPASLLHKEDLLPEAKGKTDIPSRQNDYTRESDGPTVLVSPGQERIGRTPSDLFLAFVNRPEFMATFLFALAFTICVARIQNPSDVWMPGLIGTILNSIWFGIQGLRVIRGKLQ
jgi:hypothetical protein